MRWRRMILGAAAAVVAVAPAAQADTFVVDTPDDLAGTCAATCSVRQALGSAAANPGPDSIVVPAGTYQLTSGALAVDSEVALTGAGAAVTTIVASAQSRVLEITADATLADVTVRDGAAGDAADGGNIRAQSATASLVRVRVTGGTAASGGGVANRNGTMLIADSLIDGNSAGGAGGGVHNFGGAPGASAGLTLRNTTVAFNSGSRAGGIGGAGGAGDHVTLEHVTLARNTGGGIEVDAGAVSARASIVAANTPSDCAAPLASLGGNVGSGCGFTLPGDDEGDAGLPSALEDGGLAPGPESPAVNLIADDCPPADQRGTPRPLGPGCDAGAIEVAYAVRIDAGPRGTTNDPAPEFRFSSTLTDAEFECRLDPGGEYEPCTSPRALALADGDYTFSVRTDGGLASREFTIDTVKPPAPEITAPAAGSVVGGTFTVAGTAEALAEIAVLEGGEPVADGSAGADGAFTLPVTLAEGAYALTVTAADAAGNVSPPAALAVHVDTTAPIAVIDSGPERPINTLSASFTFSSNEPDATFECALARTGAPAPEPEPCTSPAAYDGLLRGSEYTFTVRAYDEAGNFRSASRTFNVTEIGPATFIDQLPLASRDPFVDLSWTGDEGAVRFECRHVFPDDGGDEIIDDCSSPLFYRDLGDGLHRFEVRAFDAAGNVGDAGFTETVVDTIPPEPVIPVLDGARIVFAPGEPGATFECRLDGPSGDREFAACTSPFSLARLPPGEYRFTLRSLDAIGNHVDAPELAFTVDPVATPTPTPARTPTPTPAATATPTAQPSVIAAPAPKPEFRRTVVVRAVSGKVRVRRPGGAAFEDLGRAQAVPVGSTVDTKGGRVQLTVEPAAGKSVKRVVAYSGVFRITQPGATVDLTLAEALAPCAKPRSPGAKSRRLWADGKGRFRVRGRYSSAAARGTVWLVQDSCAGTLTRVKQGVVAVRDQARGRTVLLRAGKRYTAKPRR